MNPTPDVMHSALCLPKMCFETLTQHIPTDVSWAPFAGMLATGVFGIILMVRGARLAPALASIAVAALGGIGASFAAHQFGIPVWPTIAVGGAIGLVVGVVFFRLLLAGLLALTAAVVGLSVYSATALQPHIQSYAEGRVTEVRLPDAGTPAMVNEWQGLISHLQAKAPNFQTNTGVLLAATLLFGALVGFFMPKASRAFWAATAGSLLFIGVGYSLLDANFPQVTAGLGQWIYAVAAFVWAGSLIYNFNDLQSPKPKKVEAAKEE